MTRIRIRWTAMWHVRWHWQGDRMGSARPVGYTEICPKSNRKLLVKVTNVKL